MVETKFVFDNARPEMATRAETCVHTPITRVRAALHMAAVKSHGSAAMIHLLVARGHTANAKNRYGWTALDFAKQVAKLLALIVSKQGSLVPAIRLSCYAHISSGTGLLVAVPDCTANVQVKNQDAIEILDNKENADRFSTVSVIGFCCSCTSAPG